MQTTHGASLARWGGAVALCAVGLALLAYGAFGLAVVVGDWMPCMSAQASASLTSLPAGYCSTTDWVRQFGIGGILVTLGLLGIVGAVLLLRRPRGPSRDIRRR